MLPRPKEVIVLDDYKLEVKFSNEEIKIFDMKEKLKNKFYEKLCNVAYFNCAKVKDITIEWPNGEDICPDELYENSKKI